MSRSVRAEIALVALAALLPGCATKMGPKTIPGARFNYNETIARSLNEQLLLNLVRLRYRDTPLFVEVGSVIAQYELAGSVGINPTVNIDGGETNEYGFGVGGGYSESPTITYEPLKGEAFARRMLAPIDPATLALLSASGWSIERLMMCCVQELNGVDNAPSATGPAPQTLPDNASFRALAEQLRALQSAGKLRIYPEAREAAVGVRLRIDVSGDDPAEVEQLRQVRDVLGLGPNDSEFRLVTQTVEHGPGEVAVGARSLLGVLFFLSLAVEPPDEHVRNGLVGGAQLDWQTVIGGLLHVRSSASEPPAAFVRIRYRGHWFYIEDRDLNSKATFNLLTYLYSLQAGEGGGSPLLTVPVR